MWQAIKGDVATDNMLYNVWLSIQGGEPDVNTVAKMILNDWLRGNLPYFVKPPIEVCINQKLLCVFSVYHIAGKVDNACIKLNSVNVNIFTSTKFVRSS